VVVELYEEEVYGEGVVKRLLVEDLGRVIV
jgi:hypothetical protein